MVKQFFQSLIFAKTSYGSRIFKYVWLTLVICASAISLWLLASLTSELYAYFRCTKQISGKVTEWKVRQKAEEEFVLVASYQYKEKGHYFLGEQEIKGLSFKHPFAAESTIKNYSTKSWPIWVSKSKPHISTLQRTFSINLVVKTVLSIGVLVYFIWLREYIIALIKPDATEPATPKTL